MASRKKRRRAVTSDSQFLRKAIGRYAVRETVFSRKRSSREAKALLVSDFQGTLVTLARANDEAGRRVRRSCRVQLLHLDLAICVLTKLFLRTTSAGDQHLLWPKLAGEASARNTLVQNLLTAACNSLLALRAAALAGLHGTVKVLFRAHLELAEILICVVGDEDFCSRYQAWPLTLDKAAQDYWKAHVSPGRVRVVLERVLARSGLDDRMTAEISLARRDTYSWLSAHAHAHPMAVMLGAWEHEPTVKLLKPALGGRGGAWVKDVLNRLALYNAEMVMLLVRMVEMQGWEPPVEKADERDRWELMRLNLALMLLITRRVARSRLAPFFQDSEESVDEGVTNGADSVE